MKSNNLLCLELLQIVLVVGLLRRVITLIHHIRVVDTFRANHTNLVHFLLLLEDFVCALPITKQHLHLILLILLELSKFLLLRLNENFLEDELVLLLALRGEGPARALGLLLVCEAHALWDRSGLRLSLL